MSSSFLPSPVTYLNLQDNSVVSEVIPLTRDPNTNDKYALMTFAVNTVGQSAWQLVSYVGGDPVWIQLGPSSGFLGYNVAYVDNTLSPYTPTATDVYLACATGSGPISIVLPEAPETGRVFIVKDSSGDSPTNNITITREGGGDIDGRSSYEINGAYESANFIFLGLPDQYEVY